MLISYIYADVNLCSGPGVPKIAARKGGRGKLEIQNFD